MPKMYIANENGDWWEHGKLYAVSASDLKKHLAAQGEHDPQEIKNPDSIDKLDSHIKAAGKQVSINALVKKSSTSRMTPTTKKKKSGK